MNPGHSILAGRRLLLVEDEYLIAADLARTFEAAGAEVVGPVATLDDALDLVVRGVDYGVCVTTIGMAGLA